MSPLHHPAVPRHRPSRRRGALLAALSLATTLGVAGPALADVSTSAAPVAGVPFHVVFTGSAAGTDPGAGSDNRDPAVGIAVIPPGVACPASYAEVVGDVYSETAHWTRGDAASEPFRIERSLTLDDTGTYTACTYFALEGDKSIDADADATAIAYAPVPIVVARPKVSFWASVEPATAPVAGQPIRLIGSVTSNAPENITLQLNPVAKVCAATASLNLPSDALAGAFPATAVYGGPRAIRQEVTAPAAGGEYRLCGWASRTGHEGNPDVAGEAGRVTFAAPPAALATPTTPAATVGSGVAIVSTPDASLPAGPAVTVLPNAAPNPAKLTCKVSRSSALIGQQLWLRCPGATGRVEVRFTRVGRRGTEVRTASLKVNKSGTARLRTSRLLAGSWTVRVTRLGVPIGTAPLVLRNPGRS